MVAAIRTTSGVGVASPASFIRTTYGLGERAKTATVRTTYGLGLLTAAAGIRTTYGTGLVAISAGAPAVVAGPAEAVNAGDLIHLKATATPAAGATIASYTWRLVTRDVGAPLPSLSSTSAQNPTVQAVPALKAYSMTFGVIVHDSAGRASAEAQTVVTVARADRARATSSGWTLPVAAARARLDGGGWG